MSTTVIGRMLVASLHQAISEVLPGRLDFYESWLNTGGFRASRVSLAAIRAVCSFLRQEGDDYHTVMQLAGHMTSSWAYQDLSPLRRACLRALPPRLRIRAVCQLARRHATGAWEDTRALVRWRRGLGTLSIGASLFCDVRAPAPAALCRYYQSLVEGFLHELDLKADVRIAHCHALGAETCTIVVTPGKLPHTLPVAAVAAVAALTLFGGSLHAQGVAPLPTARERVLVMPLDNATREARLSWLTEGSAILLAENLSAAGVGAMTRDERLRAFERLQVPPLATLSRATVVRLGQVVGASDVITGSIAVERDVLVVKARRLHLDSGRLDPEATARGSFADLFAVYDRLADAVWPVRAEPDAVQAGHSAPSVPPSAFESYVKGLVADTPAAQTAWFGSALLIHPGYDAARIGLWRAHAAAGDHRAALASVLPVTDRSPLSIEARFLASLSHVRLAEYAEAFRVLSGLQQRAPSAIVQNNLGVVRLRSSSAAQDAGRPVWYFSQARTLDSLDADYVFNLGYAYWLDDDPRAGVYWLREAVRLNPADGGAHALLSLVLQASGQASEAARELALAQRLSSTFDTVELKAGTVAQPPRGLERLKETLEPPRAERFDAALEMVGQRDQRELALFYLERGRRLFDREHDREAASELTRALYLAPYEAEAHLLLGRLHLRSGRLREAIDAFKISLWSEETAAAHVALAEAYLEARDQPSARLEAQRALVLDPKSIQAQKLLERLR